VRSDGSTKTRKNESTKSERGDQAAALLAAGPLKFFSHGLNKDETRELAFVRV
jgi:hypothetical protein